MPGKITILSTRPLESVLLEAAKAKDIAIDIVSFIDTTPVTISGLKIAAQQAHVVFTSMNAVQAVADQLNGLSPAWTIFCIGNTTRALVVKYFGEGALKGVGNNALELADSVIANGVSQVLFFCGDQRRDDLPGKLRKHGVTVQEIIVYHTTSTPHKVNKFYDGILFFSPSAVQSFFQVNTVPSDTVLFAIGQTTADSIKTENRVVTSDKPGKEELVKKVFEYFKR